MSTPRTEFGIRNMRESKMAIGDVRSLDKQLLEEKVTTDTLYGAHISCGGRCGLTRIECLKKRKCDIKDDEAILKSQEQRYDSWMQTVKMGIYYPRLTREFNKLNFNKREI